MADEALERQLATLRASELLDAAWYLREYPDVTATGLDAAEHYLRVGAMLGRDPGPKFRTSWYLKTYPDVVQAKSNALVHYLMHGRAESRNVRPPSLAQGHQDTRLMNGVTRKDGAKPRRTGRPTVLVCGHMATLHLFGGERSLLDIIEGLSQLEFNVVATLPPGLNAGYRDELALRCLDVLTFDYAWWQKNRPLDEAAVAIFAAIIDEYAIDAVHANTIMLREALAAARRMGVPAVMHVRELLMHDAALCQLIGAEPEDIIAEAVAGADFVVANSHATAASFQKPGRTWVVPNAVDLDAFRMPAPAEDASRITVAMISSNLPKKGVLEFVEIAKLLEQRVPQARFLLVGPESDFTRHLRREQPLGRAPANLVFAGYRADPALAIREADIVVNLSLFQESFGRTVLEAMAAGRPVVVFDWGALPELVEDGVNGFVVPFRNLALAADRIAALCTDPTLLRRMGMAGRARAQATFGRSSYAARMGEAYARILSPDASPAEPLTLQARLAALRSFAPPPSPKIAYFLWHFPVPSETFVLNELRILVGMGLDVEVFCRQSPHAGFMPDFPIRWTHVADADALAGALVSSGRTVVHAHFVFPTVTSMVWPACEQAGLPFTFIAHAQDVFRYANDEQNRIGEIGRSSLCLRVLAPSRFHREYFVARGVPAEKILISPNGIDPDLYRRHDAAPEAPRIRRSVCAVHRFTEKKGLLALIDAGALLAADGVELHLYGYGPLQQQFESRIATLGLRNVHLHGEVKGRQELLEVFSRHDLFACPSVRAPDGDMDGIPTVLMEAMASRLPVLATAVSGIPDLVRDDVTGIVCEPGAEGIAVAVRRFFGLDEDAIEAITAEAEAVVRRDFDAQRLTRGLVRLWQGVGIDVMIVSWNNLPQLREVVSRLYRFTDSPFHLVICDNGSGRDVAAFLCGLYAARDNVTIVFNRDNAKVGPGTNVCLGQGKWPFAVYVCGKEGFVFDHGWERRLVDAMDRDPAVGIAGTLCYSPSYLFGRQYPAGVAEFPKFRNREFAAEHPDRPFAHVQGGLFVLRRAMVDAIGGFSDDVPHNYTDVEYSYYVESRGWALGAVPGLLSLYNKTRPGIFSRLDESVAAVHPPRLEDLPRLDRLVSGSASTCNVCEWQGDRFLGGGTCPRCGGGPADRSLMRYLAESILTYRRLPALGIGVGPGMLPFWGEQFPGLRLSGAEAVATLAELGSLPVETGSCCLVYADLGVFEDTALASLLAEASRVLRADGVLLLRAPGARRRNLGATLSAHAARAGWVDGGWWRRASAALRFDTAPLRVFGGAACVSL